jgi:hypothetical protein
MKSWVGRTTAVAWAASVALVLPALRARFSIDDFLQRLVLEGKVPEFGLGPASLYDFMGGLAPRTFIARGYLPWHSDPGLTLRFFRPLASLSIALDQRLFGRAELPSHLVNAAWFFAVTAVAFAFFRLVLSARRAGIALIVFALASGHYLNLVWTAGRHVLVGALFGALALFVHVRNAEPRLARWLAPALLLVSALASETSLAAAALIVSYELFAVEAPPRRRVLSAAPWAGAALVYLCAYAAAGYGVVHSSVYVSPLSSPGAFLAAAATRLPTLLGELSFGVPSFLWAAAEPVRPALAVLGVLTGTLVVGLAWRAAASDRERRQVIWFSSATLLATLPVVGGVADGRVLLLPSFVSVPLVATALDGAFRSSAPGPRVLVRGAGVLLGLMHLPVAALLRLGATDVMVKAARKQYELAATADLTRCSNDSPLFVVTAADPALCISGGTSLRYYRPELAARHPKYAVLSLAPQTQRLERTNDGTLLLEVEGEPREATIFEQLFRDSPLVVGQRFVLDYFSARVLATERGLFTRVAFELPENACLLTLEHERLVGTPLPARGTSRTVPHERGPLGI